jgi:hypothetical protein
MLVLVIRHKRERERVNIAGRENEYSISANNLMGNIHNNLIGNIHNN